MQKLREKVRAEMEQLVKQSRYATMMKGSWFNTWSKTKKKGVCRVREGVLFLPH